MEFLPFEGRDGEKKRKKGKKNKKGSQSSWGAKRGTVARECPDLSSGESPSPCDGHSSVGTLKITSCKKRALNGTGAAATPLGFDDELSRLSLLEDSRRACNMVP